MQSFSIRNAHFGTGELSFLLGPCVVESVDHAMFMATAIKTICDCVGVAFVYKSSFDKANRSSIESFRGQGMLGADRICHIEHGVLPVPPLDPRVIPYPRPDKVIRRIPPSLE